MCRIQEFYESPHMTLRGQLFTFEQLLATESSPHGVIDYFSEWEGFNVPRAAVSNFFARYAGHLSEREVALLRVIPEDCAYLVAVDSACTPSTRAHELAHAYWHLCPDYRHAAERVLNSIPRPLLAHLYKDLQECGYWLNVLADELHAYLLTSAPYELATTFPKMKYEVLQPFCLALQALKAPE